MRKQVPRVACLPHRAAVHALHPWPARRAREPTRATMAPCSAPGRRTSAPPSLAGARARGPFPLKGVGDRNGRRSPGAGVTATGTGGNTPGTGGASTFRSSDDYSIKPRDMSWRSLCPKNRRAQTAPDRPFDPWKMAVRQALRRNEERCGHSDSLVSPETAMA